MRPGHGGKVFRNSPRCELLSAKRFIRRLMAGASEKNYEKLTSELRDRVVGMWKQMRKPSL